MDQYFVALSDSIWYVFDEQYAVELRDTELALCHMRPWYKDDGKKGRAHAGPYFNLPTLRRDALIDYCTKATLPIDLRFSGRRVGGTHRYSGYDAADMGSQSRDITDLTCRLEVDEDHLWLRLWMRASPLHTVGKAQADPSDCPESRYDLPIPLSDVSLVLDLRPSEARIFRHRLGLPA